TIFLLDSAIKVSLVLFAALITQRLLRRHSATVRHHVLSAALLCAALMPAFNLALPPLEVKLAQSVPTIAYSPELRHEYIPFGDTTSVPVAASIGPAATAASPLKTFSMMQTAAFIWLVG